MSNIFISYSHHDRDGAERIAKDLASLNFKVWYDKEILPGEFWESRIAQELKRAKYILVILSPSYFGSKRLQNELEAATLSELGGHSRIIPILYKKTEIPSFLSSKIYADLSEDYGEGLEQLKKALSTSVKSREESGQTRFRKFQYFGQIFAALLGVAISVISSLTSAELSISPLDFIKIYISPLLLASATTIGLIFYISKFIAFRRSGLVEMTVSDVKHAYIDSLEGSEINPFRTLEVKHD